MFKKIDLPICYTVFVMSYLSEMLILLSFGRMSSTHAHALFAAATWNAVRQLLSLDRNDNNNNKTVVN